MLCLIFTLLYPFVVKTFAVQQIPSNFNVENSNVKQLRNSKPDLRQTQRRRGMQQTQGNTLGRGKKPTYLTTNFQSPWSNASPKCVCPHSISPFFSWWLNAIYMRSTATKALLPQIAHCDRHMFLILPWEDNHCFSLILWKQRKMCKSSLTLHQSALPPGPENITVFIIVTTQGKKTSLL